MKFAKYLLIHYILTQRNSRGYNFNLVMTDINNNEIEIEYED
jgi:hypothetical protein